MATSFAKDLAQIFKSTYKLSLLFSVAYVLIFYILFFVFTYIFSDFILTNSELFANWLGWIIILTVIAIGYVISKKVLDEKTGTFTQYITCGIISGVIGVIGVIVLQNILDTSQYFIFHDNIAISAEQWVRLDSYLRNLGSYDTSLLNSILNDYILPVGLVTLGALIAHVTTNYGKLSGKLNQILSK